MIGVTQPRRMAAISLAKRVAQEMGTADPGDDDGARRNDKEQRSAVGFAIRFQDRTTKYTRIKFMTDGWLLREFVRAASFLTKDGLDLDEIKDPNHPSLLPQYSVLIIDEAHERSVRTDLVLGLAKRLQRRRRELREDWEKRRKNGEADTTEAEPQLLRLVIMSATLDADLFADFFSSESAIRQPQSASEDEDEESADEAAEHSRTTRHLVSRTPAPVLYVKGRTHPVTVNHLVEPVSDWIDAARRQVLQLHMLKPLDVDAGGGDILVFGTGAEEIENLTGSLRQLSDHLSEWAAEQEKVTGKQRAVSKLVVVPLYAALGNKAVSQVFKPTPPNTRKVVVATNIAETSVTIPGIRFVVDCGLAKEKMHISHSSISGPASPAEPAANGASTGVGIETLTTRAISRSAAAQRAGRAGREAAGECFRLYPSSEYDAMEQSTVPEIHRTELTSVALDCFSAGIDPRDIPWVDAPEPTKLEAAIFELASMGAVESRAAESVPGTPARPSKLVLSDLGRRMSLLPLPPRFSHFLITASQTSSPKTVAQARDLVAILSSERSVFAEPTASGAAAAMAAESRTAPSGVDLVEQLEEKRFEAEKAKAQFRHRSGDHVTMLRAFYKFIQVRRDLGQEPADHAMTDAKAVPSFRAKDNREARLKAWCNKHCISLRAMREIEDIRDQITGICKRAGISLSEGDGHDPQVGGKDRHRHKKSSAHPLSEQDSEDSEDDLLLVTRNAQKGVDDGHDDDEQDDFVDLRRCLVSGRSTSNLAIRTSEMAGVGGNTTTYKVLCGRETFKLHPTSSLHPRNLASKSATPPKLVVFEELQYTTQLYVRTATEVDIEWVQEAARRSEERRVAPLSRLI
ncbi:unnamed protein product [Parajaminaea phylloscopi]